MDLLSEGVETIAGVRRPEPSSEDEMFMLRALEIAERGRGRTSPNPIVGAVIAREGTVLGEGYHQAAGMPHAEVNALNEVTGDTAGATMYVTLEPCAHQGRTPPCANRIIDSRIARVVTAIGDPNPLVGGKGKKLLQEHGVDVVTGVLSEIALRQNEAYLKWVTCGLPFVTLKMAISLDGKVATRTGDSKWISSDFSREDVQRIRDGSDAVLVGIGTVIQDDPRLTVRMGEGKCSPLRVVVDSLGRTPLESHVADTEEASTLIAVSDSAPARSVEALKSRGMEVVRLDDGGRVDLKGLLGVLGERGITSLLVEGGPELTRGLWEAGLVDKLVFYYAPKIIAGCTAPGPIGGTGVSCIDEAVSVAIDAVFAMGPDFKVIAYPGGGLACSRE